MSVSIQCPDCGTAYNVKDERIGARAQCKSCGNRFTLSISMDDTGKSSPDDAAVRSSHAKSSIGKGKGQRKSPERSGKLDPQKTPKKLGNYVVQRKLGAGAMGVVYLGRDPILDRQVAIKVLPAVFSSDKERLKRFLREAKSAARLHHTNVAAVHQAGAEGRLAYIAMEYVEGTSLDKAVLEEKPMDWREATRVVRDAAAGLGAAHALELVHRDIKPGNLIRTPDGVTKVVDFGLARGQQTDTQLTQQGTLLGTPAYMAPEQWSGGEVDGRSDLYSLACTYYYLLTGKLPYDAPTLPALGYQHRYEPFPDPREVVPGIPDEVCRVLIRGSAKDAAERFQAAEALASELDVIAACPDETLAFGSPWTDLAGTPHDVLPPADDPLGDDFSPLETLAPTTTLSKPAQETASSPRVPGWIWIAIGGGAAMLLLLFSVVMLFSTEYGTVQITVHNADENVQITVDGDTIAVEGLNEPLKLKVGEHDLVATLPNFETVTKSFQVKDDETTVLEVTFVPKAIPGQLSKEVAEVPTTSPATYRVTVYPPQATLAANGTGVSVSGRGGERTVKVSEPDGQSKVTLVAMLDGYQDYRQELQPVAGESKHLIVRLELDLKLSPASPVSHGKETTPQAKPAQTEPSAMTVADVTEANEPKADGSTASKVSTLPTELSKPSLLAAPFDGQAAKQSQQRWAEYLDTDITITNSIGMKLTLIPPGEFMMGSKLSPDQTANALKEVRADAKAEFFLSEHPRHRVRITKPYWLGVYEVTQGEYAQVMGANPSHFKGSTRLPIEKVAWEDAAEFCRRLSALGEEKRNGRAYRLPTEAEWEYACRAGTTTVFCLGDSLSSIQANVKGDEPNGDAPKSRSLERTTAVGSYEPNDWGIYDMHGNVQEWCHDWYGEDYYANSPVDDPVGPAQDAPFRVDRGGAFWHSAHSCRSACRSWHAPDYRREVLGFRVVVTVTESPNAAEQGTGETAETLRGASSPKTITNSIGMKLVQIPAGEFMMGSQKSRGQLAKTFAAYDAKTEYFKGEHPPHRVRITKPFFLGAHEVTVGHFRKFVEAAGYRTEAERDGKGGWGYNAAMRSQYGGGLEEGRQYTWRRTGWSESDQHPVVNVTWNDAVAFCEWLSDKESKTYRLPTEAEWEHACRANTTTLWFHGDEPERLTQVGNVGDAMAYPGWLFERPLRTQDGYKFTAPVGSFQPNTFGLYDMHGNVWEYCSDWYGEDYYRLSPTDDPTGPSSGSTRVRRGGSYAVGPSQTRSARRDPREPDDRTYHDGFRVAMAITKTTAAAKTTVDEGSAGQVPALPDGCVVAYSFDRDTIFSQGSRQYVRDLSGNDYHGLLNNVTITDGKVGMAAEFAGKPDSYIKLPDENGQYPTNDLTIVGWFYVTDGGGYILDLNFATSSVASQTGGLLWYFVRTSESKAAGLTGIGLDCTVGGGLVNRAQRVMSSLTIRDEQWTHIAVSRKGGTVTSFINGKIDMASTSPAGNIIYRYQGYDDNSVNIGTWKRTGLEVPAGSYDGLIDEFALFDRALSEQEVADIYQRQAGG